MISYVFDLDGTLVETRLAVFTAYMRAGVVMPQDAWGRSASEWLTDPEVHRRKVAAYPEKLRLHGQILPLLKYAQDLEAPIITGASAESVSALEKTFSIKLNVQLFGASTEDKIHWLKTYNPGTARRIYVDDNLRACIEIRGRTTWYTVLPRECLRSFLQRAPIRDSRASSHRT